MPQPRQLNFASLDEANAEAEHLLAAGYESAGQWNLAQCCGHCSQWLGFLMDGFPKQSLPMRGMMWVMRHTIGKRQRRLILADGFKPGLPTMPSTVPTADAAADAAAVNELREVIERFQQYEGPLHSSPFFGELTRDEWTTLHRHHLAHHLGFLVPHE